MSLKEKILSGFSRAFKNFEKEKENISKLSLQEKRKRYKCGNNYATVDKIDVWSKFGENSQCDPEFKDVLQGHVYKHDPKLNDKIGIYFGNIITLEIDVIVHGVIVNVVNTGLVGGGADIAIHLAAGPFLYEECKTFENVEMGVAKITAGYNLPAKYVIHAVGPVEENASNLESCYKNSLQLAVENNLKTIAFPCLSTGVYLYPNKEAAQVVLKTVRDFLESNCDDMDLIIFCLTTDVDKTLYRKMLPYFFPIA